MSRHLSAPVLAGAVTAAALVWGVHMIKVSYLSVFGLFALAAAAVFVAGPPLLLRSTSRRTRLLVAAAMLLATAVAALGTALLGVGYPLTVELWRLCRAQTGDDPRCGGEPSPWLWLISTVVLAGGLVATWVLTGRTMRPAGSLPDSDED